MNGSVRPDSVVSGLSVLIEHNAVCAYEQNGDGTWRAVEVLADLRRGQLHVVNVWRETP